VRVLFSCNASEGHFQPLVPLARAFVERGDDVVFATAAGFATRVGEYGFDVLPAGLDNAQLNKRYEPYRERLHAIPFDDRRPYSLAWRFGELDAPAKLDELLAQARAWQPELIVHETCDLAAPPVAAAIGVRSAFHSFGVLLPQACLDRVVPAVEPLWRAVGLKPEPIAGLFRGAYVDVYPPSLQTSHPPQGTQVIPLRPAMRAAAGAGWRERLPAGKPIVYVTLGTQFNEPARFPLLVEALAGVDCTAVMTIGTNQDPARLRAPANVIIERYIPQAEILPLAAAVVCHGGSGSTLAALAHGAPLVLLPAGADQFDNAAACVRAGAGIELRPPEVTVESVRVAVNAVLDEPAYAAAAERLAEEVETMLTPAQAAAILS
jgi:UDP:flavonoid glycosyltransferase YjiC (YdhE family)